MAINKLTKKDCDNAKCKTGTGSPSLYNDGDGLYLRVYPNGNKNWAFRFTWNGVPTWAGFTSYPELSLADARQKRTVARQQLAQGIDPRIYLNNLKKKKINQSVDYVKYKFSYIKDKTIEFKSDQVRSKPWSTHHVKRCEAIWNNYIVPQGYHDYSITEITEDVVVEMMQYILNNPVEKVSGRIDRKENPGLQTMNKAKSLINQIFIHAKQVMRLKQPDGKSIDNPVSQLTGNPLFEGINRHKQFKSADIEDAGRLWSKVKELTNMQDRLFLMINISTTLRVGSQVRLTWAMFDKTKKLFSLPGKLMKNGIPFETPIPDDLVDGLVKLKEAVNPDESDFIFTGRAEGSHYGNNRPRELIKKLGFNVTAHGNRTLFKDVNENLNKNNIAIEFQLSHSSGTKNKVENSYVKSKNYWQTRRKLVVDYYNYLEEKSAEYEAILALGKVSTATK